MEGSVSGRQLLGHESVVVDCSHSPASSSSSLGKQQLQQQQQQKQQHQQQQQQQQQQSYVRTSAIKLLDTYQIHNRQAGLKRKLETSNEVQVGSSCHHQSYVINFNCTDLKMRISWDFVILNCCNGW